ncbi:hypothetical protein N656DRAFT_787082 [Canariomyces notabilis]|uniref:Uncharacterized protein n=1 Tax=Canariomyces notabilis TaxID=2074819 RepID=A0AAN6YX65_9PEZI|nr:hypothetical protein N656DRAFT_787082 [Canariomyces arenarius]
MAEIRKFEISFPLTIRLKHGIHTIFLFAMPDWTFSRLTAELLFILQDRYPDGLTTSISRAITTSVPASGDDVKVVYARPKNPNDLSEGWKNLNAQPTDTIAEKGLKENCAVAFALLDPEADVEDVEFLVELPMQDYDEA